MQLQVSLSVEEKGKKAPQYTLESDSAGEMTFQDFVQHMRATLISVAGTVLKEEQAMGFDKAPVIVVDGNRGKPTEQVSPFGKIEIFSRVSSSDLVLDIYDDLVRLSPVGEGQYYVSHHIVQINNHDAGKSREEIQAFLQRNPLQDKDIVRFVNAMPYAGWLERNGTTAKRKSKVKMVKSRDKRRRMPGGMVRRPNGVYYIVGNAYKRKYKANSFISFGFMPGDQLELTQPMKVSTQVEDLRRTFGDNRGGKGKFGGKYKGYYVYPYIAIRVRGEGVT